MTLDQLVKYVRAMDGVVLDVASETSGAPEVAWGDVFCFSGRAPDGSLHHRDMFATIVTGDYPGFDEKSRLSRDGAFRLNVAVGAAIFERLIGQRPAEIGGSIGDIDFATPDRILPHPVYFAQSWVAIVNPGPRTDEVALEILSTARGRARSRA